MKIEPRYQIYQNHLCVAIIEVLDIRIAKGDLSSLYNIKVISILDGNMSSESAHTHYAYGDELTHMSEEQLTKYAYIISMYELESL